MAARALKQKKGGHSAAPLGLRVDVPTPRPARRVCPKGILSMGIGASHGGYGQRLTLSTRHLNKGLTP